MSVMRDVFSEYTETYQTRKESEMSLMEYLELCGTDPMAFACPRPHHLQHRPALRAPGKHHLFGRGREPGPEL